MADERSWTGPPPDRITAWTLVQAGHVVGRRFWEALGKVGLSPTQFGVLLELDIHPGLSNGEIARAVLVTPQTMSELLSSLATLGLVERDAPPGRGHRVTTRLTAAGRTTLARCAAAVDEVESSLDLSTTAAAALNSTLHRIIGSPPERGPAA